MKKLSRPISLNEMRTYYCSVVPRSAWLFDSAVHAGERVFHVFRNTWEHLRPFIHLFGVESDSAIARKSSIARTRIILFRQNLGIAPFRATAERASPSVKKDVIRLLREGATLKKCRDTHNLRPTTVRAIAASIGWSEAWTVRNWGAPRKTHFGKYTLEDVIEMSRNGFSLERIGNKINRTRERVRQILRREGEPPATDRIRRDRAQRRARKQKERATVRARRRREQQKRARAIRRALSAVKKKVPMRVAAEKNGLTFATLWYEITKVRRTLGADALPYKSSLGGISRPFPVPRSTPSK